MSATETAMKELETRLVDEGGWINPHANSKRGEPIQWYDGSMLLPCGNDKNGNPLYACETQVTWRQWFRFCDETGYPTPQIPDFFTETEVATGAMLDHPVVNISFDDLSAYAGWAGLQIPLLDHWLQAVVGDNESWPYPWGDHVPTRADKLLNCADTGPGRTTPVGSYPNGNSIYGIMDPVGNVWVWIAEPEDKFEIPKDYKQVRACDTFRDYGIEAPPQHLILPA